MVLYECPRCHYETTKKSHMRNHYSRKHVCQTVYSRKSIKDCLQELSSMKRKTYEELERENKMLIDCKTVVINNNNINNTYNIDNSNNLNISSYKDNDYSFIKDLSHCLVNRELIDENKEILDMGRLINTLFYDNEKNHNIFMSNTNNRRIMEYDGENFIEKGKNEDGLLLVIEDVKMIIDKWFDDSPISDEFSVLYQMCLDRKNKDFDQKHKDLLRKIFSDIASAMVNGKIPVKKTFEKQGVKINRDGTCVKTV